MKCKPVPGFEKQYVISKAGDIFRRLGDGHSKISPATNDDGYKTVVLYKDSKPSFKYVHKLVADAWGVEHKAGKDIVNHKDGDKKNNDPDNLERVDPGQNTRHAYKRGLAHGPKGEVNGRSKLTKGQVSKIKKSKKSGTSLSDLYDVTPATISLIKQGKRW